MMWHSLCSSQGLVSRPHPYLAGRSRTQQHRSACCLAVYAAGQPPSLPVMPCLCQSVELLVLPGSWLLCSHCRLLDWIGCVIDNSPACKGRAVVRKSSNPLPQHMQ